MSHRRGFTLIELLIVIAIILILIAIALPNFLEAQARAKVTRERSDIRTLSIAIEELRIDYGFLLVDFWDDDNGRILGARFNGLGATEPPRFATCCSWHSTNRRGGTTGLFSPLTTPIAYLTSVPIDPFAYELGDVALISDDTKIPISYMYHDRESKDLALAGDDFRGVSGCYVLGNCLPGTHGIEKPLAMDHYLLIGFGPDMERNDDLPIPYAPTNGTKSFGDVIERSDG
jgi:prepilin-type N-terminal cleavage/methylation domain-containing protein